MDERRDAIDVFAEVARSLADENTLAATLQRIVEEAVATVRGAEFASVSLVRARREVKTIATTDDLSCRVDEIQYETGEVPVSMLFGTRRQCW